MHMLRYVDLADCKVYNHITKTDGNSMDYNILLELAIILLSTKALGIVMRKLGLPQVVGALIAGLVVGPCLIGAVHPSGTISILAEIGVIMIMFSAGLESNLKEIKLTGKAAFIVASLGVVVPLSLGFLLAALFGGGFAGADQLKILQYVFVGIIMTATSVTITVETLREMGKLKTEAGTIILSAAIIDDVIGIILLSVIMGINNPDVQPLLVIGKNVLFFVLAIGVGIGLHFLFKWLSKRYPHHRRVPIFAFVACLLYAYCGEHFFGVADITGAYIAGILFSGISVSDYIDQKIDVNAYMIFAPVFFANIGLRADFSAISLDMLWFTLAFVAVAVLSKFAGCYGASRLLKNDRQSSLIIGFGMIARGEVALIVTQRGIDSGLVPSSYLVVAMSLVIVSSLLAPIILRLLYKKEKHPFDANIQPPTTQKIL